MCHLLKLYSIFDTIIAQLSSCLQHSSIKLSGVLCFTVLFSTLRVRHAPTPGSKAGETGLLPRSSAWGDAAKHRDCLPSKCPAHTQFEQGHHAGRNCQKGMRGTPGAGPALVHKVLVMLYFILLCLLFLTADSVFI
ncbi:MAG: hypothetical protein FRX49_07090 [Trebouxia sp. A1-2]|nr:MAG: hypothetical protein FRX49_07090 [Trebouxia sp. A1-2]